MATDNIIWLTLGMLAVTYLGRVSGYWFIRFVEPGPKTQTFLRLVPGTIFMAMVAPQLLRGDWQGWVAAGVIFAVAAKSGNLFVALTAGMAVYVGLQLF